VIQLTERLARVLYESANPNSPMPWARLKPADAAFYRVDADACLAGIKAAGFKLVPEETTENKRGR
jgi:hypothetical protein